MEKTTQFEDDNFGYKGKITLTDEHNLSEELFIEIEFTRYLEGYHNPTTKYRAGLNQMNSVSAGGRVEEYEFKSDEQNPELKMFQSNSTTELKVVGWTVDSRTEVHPDLGDKILEFLQEHLEKKGDALVPSGGE